jgi:hypothetical protein
MKYNNRIQKPKTAAPDLRIHLPSKVKLKEIEE